MWEAVERFHGVGYLAPETREEADAIGLKGAWMAYFASRAAPLGAVPPSVVLSTFFYFGPSRVNRAIPDAWRFATPEDVLTARYHGIDRALRRTHGGAIDTSDVTEAAALVREAAGGCGTIGRVLHDGWAALDWPEEPHLALWHGCTLLREYRSGNHLMALCVEGVDGCESVVSHVAVGGAPRDWIRHEAGWTEADERFAVERLQNRGWLDDAGQATAACRRGRERIEKLTDELDFPVWQRLGESNASRLFELLTKLVAPLPADDQIDWRSLYDEHGAPLP